MKLTFAYTADDIMEAARAPGDSWRTIGRRLRSREFRNELRRQDLLMFLGVLLQVSGCLLAASACAYLTFSRRSAGWLLPMAGLLVIPGFYMFAIARARGTRTITRQFDEDPHVADERQFELDERGFALRSAFGSAGASWSRLRRVAETPNLLILITSGASFVVPRRAFASTAEQDAFLATVRPRVTPEVKPFPDVTVT